jgi:hypothetical protein
VLGGTVLGGTVLGGTVLGGTVLGGSVEGDAALSVFFGLEVLDFDRFFCFIPFLHD